MKIVVLFFALAGVGCGGAPDAFRSTIAATSEAVKAADAQVAPVYGREADRCRTSSESWSAYRECMTTQDGLAAALETAAQSLYTAEAALDSWDDQVEEGAEWYAFAPCLTRALARLIGVFEAAGLPLPEAVRTGLSFVAAFGGQCSEAE